MTLYLFLDSMQSHHRIPRSLEQESERFVPDEPHTRVDHVLHKHWALGLEHLQNVQVYGQQVPVEHLQKSLMTVTNQLGVLKMVSVQ